MFLIMHMSRLFLLVPMLLLGPCLTNQQKTAKRNHFTAAGPGIAATWFERWSGFRWFLVEPFSFKFLLDI